MPEQHEVLLRQAPTPDDEGQGVEAILRAFIRNPMGAFKIVGFIVAVVGLYYATQNSISDVKASSEEHYKDLAAELQRNNERLIGRVEVLVSNDTSQAKRIEEIFTRGDTRWGAVQTKLNEGDVKFARIEGSINYIVRFLEKNAPVSPELGMMPNK